MINFISLLYKKEIEQITNCCKTNDNVLLISPDKLIIENIVDNLKALYKNKKWNIEDVQSKKSIKNNTIVFIKLDGNSSLSSNTLLYYYLELSNEKKCKLIFYSQSTSAIDNMERRVKSRFSNEVFLIRGFDYFEYISLYKYLVYKEALKNHNKKKTVRSTAIQENSKFKTKQVDNTVFKMISAILSGEDISLQFKDNLFIEKMFSKTFIDSLTLQFEINKDLCHLIYEFNRLKLDLDKLTLESILKMFNTTHLVILLMSTIEKVYFTNVVKEFRKFVTNCKELKKCSDDEIFLAYCELIDFNILSNQGLLLINVTCLRKFINLPDKPNYLKSLLNKRILL